MVNANRKYELEAKIIKYKAGKYTSGNTTRQITFGHYVLENADRIIPVERNIHRDMQIRKYKSAIQIGKYTSGNTNWQRQTENPNREHTHREIQIGKYISGNTVR